MIPHVLTPPPQKCIGNACLPSAEGKALSANAIGQGVLPSLVLSRVHGETSFRRPAPAPACMEAAAGVEAMACAASWGGYHLWPRRRGCCVHLREKGPKSIDGRMRTLKQGRWESWRIDQGVPVDGDVCVKASRARQEVGLARAPSPAHPHSIVRGRRMVRAGLAGLHASGACHSSCLGPHVPLLNRHVS